MCYNGLRVRPVILFRKLQMSAINSVVLYNMWNVYTTAHFKDSKFDIQLKSCKLRMKHQRFHRTITYSYVIYCFGHAIMCHRVY